MIPQPQPDDTTARALRLYLLRQERARKLRRRQMLTVMVGDALAWLGILALIFFFLYAYYGWL